MKSHIRLVLEIVALLALLSVGVWYSEREPTQNTIENEELPTPPRADEPSFQKSEPKAEPSPARRFSDVKPRPYSGFQPEKSFLGFTLYPENGTALIRLVNMTGDTVHSWKMDAERARLLPNGNLLVLHGSKWGLEVEPWKSLQNVIREYDWNGKLVWEYTLADKIHHDLRALPNGNVLGIHRLELPATFTERSEHPRLRGIRLRSDEIFEVNRKGERVWRWFAHEHINVNSCGKFDCPDPLRKNVRSGEKAFDWTHTNTVSVVPENKWFDGGDRRFAPGNILTILRNHSTAYIIDRDSKEIVWSYTGDYKGGIQYAHEISMIPKGRPGAGNILLLDNGSRRGSSVVLEVNPTTKHAEWVYDGGRSFFTRVSGSVERLPNGNTLISEDLTGRVFEVTQEKEIVWQFRQEGIKRICRAQRYGIDYAPQFANLAEQ